MTKHVNGIKKVLFYLCCALIAIKVVNLVIVMNDTKQLTHSGEPLLVYSMGTHEEYIDDEILFRAYDKIYFRAKPMSSVKDNRRYPWDDIYYFEATDIYKLGKIDCKKYEPIYAPVWIIVDEIQYAIEGITPSGKCYIISANQRNADQVSLYSIQDQRVVGTFAIERRRYADCVVSPDDTKVAFRERNDIFVIDIETNVHKKIADSIEVSSGTLRWVNNDTITFTGFDSMTFWGHTLAYSYNCDKEKLITVRKLTNIMGYGNGYHYNLFWSPNGERLYCFYYGTNLLRRWR